MKTTVISRTESETRYAVADGSDPVTYTLIDDCSAITLKRPDMKVVTDESPRELEMLSWQISAAISTAHGVDVDRHPDMLVHLPENIPRGDDKYLLLFGNHEESIHVEVREVVITGHGSDSKLVIHWDLSTSHIPCVDESCTLDH